MGLVGGSMVENSEVDVDVVDCECVDVIVWGVGMVKAVEEAVRDKMARA